MPKVVVGLLNAEQEFQQLQATDAREAARRLKLDVQISFAEGHIHKAPAEPRQRSVSLPASVVLNSLFTEDP